MIMVVWFYIFIKGVTAKKTKKKGNRNQGNIKWSKVASAYCDS